MMKRTIFFLIIIGLLNSCGNPKEESKIEDPVIIENPTNRVLLSSEIVWEKINEAAKFLNGFSKCTPVIKRLSVAVLPVRVNDQCVCLGPNTLEAKKEDPYQEYGRLNWKRWKKTLHGILVPPEVVVPHRILAANTLVSHDHRAVVQFIPTATHQPIAGHDPSHQCTVTMDGG
jgi:hypothetical protein